MRERREIRYEDLDPLLVDKEYTRGDDLRCLFECPVSGARYEVETMISERRDLGSEARESIVRRIFRNLGDWVGALVRAIFGSGAAGHLAESVADGAADVTEDRSGLEHSSAEVRDAVVEAFEDLQFDETFVWVEASDQWVALAPDAGEEAQVVEPSERSWLRRRLEEAASEVDGEVVGGAGGMPELRTTVDGAPVRIRFEGETDQPTLDVQVSRQPTGLLVLQWREGANPESEADGGDPWADVDDSGGETVVAPEIVAHDSRSVQTFEELSGEFRRELLEALRTYRGHCAFQPELVEFTGRRPLHAFADPVGALTALVDLAGHIVRASR